MDLNLVLDELEKREQHRNNLRHLRDKSNPFNVPNEVFRQLYRLDPEGAHHLFQELLPFLANGQRNTRTHPTVRFFTTLAFLAHGSYQKPVGSDHLNASSQANVSRSIHEVVNVMVDNLANRYIRFPQNAVEIANVKQGFFEKFHIPGIIGCVDCTHVKIVPPSYLNLGYPAHVFVNRKQFYSINTQIVCDVNLKILSINAQFPGSVHDAAIWRMSRIRAFLHRNFIAGDQHTYLLGDSGYPLLPYLLTPIPHAPLGSPEARYTSRHQQIRNCIERTNGVLKGVWRCLHSDRVLHYTPSFTSKIIYACAILHNFIIMHNLPVDPDLFVEDDPYPENEENPEELDDNQLLNRGHMIRNRVINEFFQN